MSLNILDKKYFIFDLDGTLIDSNSLHEKAFLVALEGTGKEFDYRNFHGVKTLDVFTSLGFSLDVAKNLTKKKQEEYRKYILSGDVTVFKGVDQIFKRLIFDGKKIFLCTGASRKSVNQIIDSMGWKSIFTDTICGDEVEFSKPDPLILNELIERNGLLRDNILYVEDSDKGLETGINGNVDTVIVNNYFENAIISFSEFLDFYEYYFEFSKIKGVA